MIKNLFAPILGSGSDSQTLALAAEIGIFFHAHVDVGIRVRGGDEVNVGAFSQDSSADAGRTDGISDRPGGQAQLDPAVVVMLENWRQRYRLRPDPRGCHFGLPSTSWSSIDGEIVRGVARRAMYADLTCLATERDECRAIAPIVRSILFASGRALLLVPVSGPSMPPVLGEPIVIGWNGSVEAAHATRSAIPFLEISSRIDIISIGEDSVNAIEAYSLARYLAHRRIQAEASGIAQKDWTGGDVIDAAVDRGARLLVMGAHVRRGERGFGNATRHVLERIPIPVLMSS